MISIPLSRNSKKLKLDRLPERVGRAILSQQAASERLVGWVQLAVLMLFGILYAVSPKTFSPEKTFTLVPWFLGVR